MPNEPRIIGEIKINVSNLTSKCQLIKYAFEINEKHKIFNSVPYSFFNYNNLAIVFNLEEFGISFRIFFVVASIYVGTNIELGVFEIDPNNFTPQKDMPAKMLKFINKMFNNYGRNNHISFDEDDSFEKGFETSINYFKKRYSKQIEAYKKYLEGPDFSGNNGNVCDDCVYKFKKRLTKECHEMYKKMVVNEETAE